MNIDKVNATLGKAIVHIREGEVDDLMSALAEDDESDDFVTTYFGGLVDQVVESAGVEYDAAFEIVTGVVSDLAEATPAKVQTEADIDAWAKDVGLAEAIAKRLN